MKMTLEWVNKEFKEKEDRFYKKCNGEDFMIKLNCISCGKQKEFSGKCNPIFYKCGECIQEENKFIGYCSECKKYIFI